MTSYIKKGKRSDEARLEAIIQRDLVAVEAMPKLAAALAELPSKRARLLALHGLVIFYDERAAVRIGQLANEAVDDELCGYADAAPNGCDE